MSPLSTGNGNAAASLKTSKEVHTTSISPVGISLFSFPAGLALTSPLIKTHHSARNSPAIFSSLITTCTAPVESLKSMKATPP